MLCSLLASHLAGLALASGVPFVPSAAAEQGLTGTLVFQTASGGLIYTIGANGGHLRQLTTGMDPALSPDGQWVAFTRWEDTQNGALGSLWVIRVDGSGERAILGDIQQPKSPAWSPDGAQIAISMQHGGRLAVEQKCSSEPPPREAYDVRIKRENDGDVRFCYMLPPHPFWGLRVVDVVTGKFQDLTNDLFSYTPTWDPANAWHLVYHEEQGLMSLDLNQGKTWPLTDDVDDHSPAFSPNGSKLAVAHWQGDHWDIEVMNADGSGRARLTETSLRTLADQIIKGETAHSSNNTAPTWSPDGSHIAFLTDRTGQWEIWVMQADGSDQRPLFAAGVSGGSVLQYHNVDERVVSWR
jgi:Tol biopolymer transport system component